VHTRSRIFLSHLRRVDRSDSWQFYFSCCNSDTSPRGNFGCGPVTEPAAIAPASGAQEALRPIANQPYTFMARDARSVVVNRAGALTSRSGVKYILSVALAVASGPCPTLTGPRSTRHTAPPQCDAPPAVRRGHHGHRSVTRSRESDHHAPFEAGLSMKEVALRHVGNPAPEPLRFNAPDRLLAILEDL
jgi:hypothetical protein